MKKIILGGVCATALAISTTVSVISCSGDEEYYEGGNYTLANKRVTRGAPGDPDIPSDTKVGPGKLLAGELTGSISTSDGNVKYNYTLRWSECEINSADIHIIPTNGLECSKKTLSYIDEQGKLVEMEEISSPTVSGLSGIKVHNYSFYLPNITFSYKQAKKKTVSYGCGYIYEY